ncbi:MAG TPA: glycosyl hydrolase 115 family protein [Terracidiphilus sp.]|nr:glycosyl hydrolase 115 family protein [Terracidiphilus sp.]
MMTSLWNMLTTGRRGRSTIVAATAALLFLVSAGALAQSSSNAIPLNSRATILVDSEQPVPIQRAAEDLAADMKKVFGAAPKIISTEAEAGPVTIVLGKEASGAAADHDSAPEAFSITSGSATLSSGRKVQVIRLAGSDMRGTLYAIYQFSQQYLGVDPMYYWTDHEPAKHALIHIPASLDVKFPAPVFRYRGFFINDEDLLTGWAPGEAKDHTGISLAVWNKICETILRLKGNMIVAGTWPFPNEPQDRVVAERGLLLNQHHAEPLGVNFSRWPHDVPYNFTADPQYIENAWKNAVASDPKDQQILWEIGLRGLSDEPYAALDPSVRGNDKAQGHLISKAIAEQMRIVRAKYPDAVFITDLWMEGAKLMRSGDLVIPPEVITVWADTGWGYMQDDGEAKSGEGAYIHVAMYNTVANQLSEMTPVSRIFSSLGRFEKAGATSFLLVNTSDIRPVTMGASAVLDFGWRGASIGSSDEFYKNWSSEEFGAKAAPAVEAVYKAYFNAPADLPGTPPRSYGDNYYHTMARELMRNVMIQWPTYWLPGQSPFWTKPSIHPVPYNADWAPQQAEKEIKACGDAEPRWDAVWKQALAAEPLVAVDRRDFYQAGVLTMIAINRDSNRMLLALSEAVMALHNDDHATAVAKTRQALEDIDEIKESESKAEYGKWKNWYHGDWLTGVDRTRELVEDFAKYLQNPDAPVPPPIEWRNWEGYYHIQHYEGTRTVDVH